MVTYLINYSFFQIYKEVFPPKCVLKQIKGLTLLGIFWFITPMIILLSVSGKDTMNTLPYWITPTTFAISLWGLPIIAFIVLVFITLGKVWAMVTRFKKQKLHIT
jgi:uncharacterized phage infection (PIP) family protein YhgE